MRVPSKSLRAFRRRYKVSSDLVAAKMGLSATSLLKRELIEWGTEPLFEEAFDQACRAAYHEKGREMERESAARRGKL
jgi:hypothetical protein